MSTVLGTGDQADTLRQMARVAKMNQKNDVPSSALSLIHI